MKNNPTLDKNLNLIARYNPQLKNKIMNVEFLTKDIQFSNTAMQEPNLTYNGIPLHDLVGAEIEAKNIFSKVNNNPMMMHLVYGLGLGYLFQQFALNSMGIVLVYEPDLEILARTLEVADLSEELSKQNVYVFNDFAKFESAYQNLRIEGSSTVISFLPSYSKIFGDNINAFAKSINQVMGRAILNENYFKNKLRPAVKMVCENISSLVNEPPLLKYENFYKGKTAIVVSAGPSLDKNIETLKKYKDNVVIIAVLQALRTLEKNGITPDFVVSIEQIDTTAQLKDIDTSKSYLILEPLSHQLMHVAKFKGKISYPSCSSIANNIWTSFANIDNRPYISNGTVSYTAVYSAMLLGCKKIVLVGQDLAFCGGKCYSNGTNRGLIYKENSTTGKIEVVVADGQKEKIKEALYGKANFTDDEKERYLQKYVDNINSKLYYVEGIKGNKLPTTVDYASFISQFEEFATKFGNFIELYNTSLEGAKIKGFNDISLDELLINSKPIEKLSLDMSSSSYNLNKIINSIKEEIEILRNISNLIKKASNLVLSYEKELVKNNNELNSQAGAYFKQLMILYIDLSDNYSKKSLIFKYIHKAISGKISYSLRMNKIADSKSINLMFENLKKYFAISQKDYDILIKTIEEKVKFINEMLDTKS